MCRAILFETECLWTTSFLLCLLHIYCLCPFPLLWSLPTQLRLPLWTVSLPLCLLAPWFLSPDSLNHRPMSFLISVMALLMLVVAVAAAIRAVFLQAFKYVSFLHRIWIDSLKRAKTSHSTRQSTLQRKEWILRTISASFSAPTIISCRSLKQHSGWTNEVATFWKLNRTVQPTLV